MKSRKTLSPVAGLLRRLRAAQELSDRTGISPPHFFAIPERYVFYDGLLKLDRLDKLKYGEGGSSIL